MKNTYLKLLLLSISTILFMSSCGSDPSGGNGGNGDDKTITEQRNEWIYTQMSEWYLWRDDVLAKVPNYKTSDHKVFFNRLLSTDKEDGYLSGNGKHYFYSFIDMVATDTRSGLTSNRSFGFEFDVANISSTQLCYVVTYVVPGSPADNNGLKRGHLINKVNNTIINTLNHKDLSRKLLTEEHTNTPLNAATISGIYFTEPDNISETTQPFHYALNPASVVDNSIHYDTTITLNDGKKVGYMVYNSFESGYPNIKNSDFNNKMKRGFSDFKSAGITDLVLDFRYNGGGLTSCALLLAGMVNNSNQGQVFNTYAYNTYVTNKYLGGSNESDKIPTLDQMKNTWATYEGERVSIFGTDEGVNLGLSRVFILATERTASSSELVVNGLRGLGVEVILIGARTHGKGVGMTSLYEGGVFGPSAYYLWPVSFMSYNKNNDRIPVGGYIPDIEVNYFNGGIFFPFGDTRDPLLGVAIDYIEGRSTRNESRSASSLFSKSNLPSSHEHKPNQGILRIITD